MCVSHAPLSGFPSGRCGSCSQLRYAASSWGNELRGSDNETQQENRTGSAAGSDTATSEKLPVWLLDGPLFVTEARRVPSLSLSLCPLASLLPLHQERRKHRRCKISNRETSDWLNRSRRWLEFALFLCILYLKLRSASYLWRRQCRTWTSEVTAWRNTSSSYMF